MKKLLILFITCSLWLAANSQTYYKVENGNIVKVGLPLTDTINGVLYYQNFRSLPDSVLYQQGWRWNVVVPEHDSIYERLGDVYYDLGNDVITYHIDSVHYDLQTLKENHYRDLDNTFNEASQIIIQLNNRYNPMGVSPERIPAELVGLLQYMNPKDLLTRGTAEIDSLSTIEEALNYKVRGPEIEGYINTLKSFL